MGALPARPPNKIKKKKVEREREREEEERREEARRKRYVQSEGERLLKHL